MTGAMIIPPIAPAIPPIPTTEPTACFGKVSEEVVKRFADHPWCAAAAIPIKNTAIHKFDVKDAKTIGTTARAQINIAVLRPVLIVQPRLINAEETYPPPT